jgi:O-antigen ligase
MNKITYAVVWLMVFIVPFEERVSIEQFASIARMLGYAALVLAFFAVIMQGGIRHPPATHILLALFWAWSVASLAWTISGEQSLARLPTYSALLLFAWLIWEFAPTFIHQVLLLWAYILGYCVSLADEAFAFLHSGSGPQFSSDEGRLTGGGLNENDIAYVAAIVIPLVAFMALRVVKNRILRIACWALIPLAAFGIVLTGSRGGTIALAAGMSVLLLSLRRATWGFRIMFVVAGLAGATLIMFLSPEQLLSRITEGAESHTLQLRQDIWTQAFRRWADSPILGAGTGTFRLAVWGITGGFISHNLFVTVIVETGIVGLAFYAGAALMTFYSVWRLPAEDRPFFLAVLVVWLLAAMVSPWEYNKSTWFLLSLVTTISVTKRAAASKQEKPAARLPSVVMASPLGGSRWRPT